MTSPVPGVYVENQPKHHKSSTPRLPLKTIVSANLKVFGQEASNGWNRKFQGANARLPGKCRPGAKGFGAARKQMDSGCASPSSNLCARRGLTQHEDPELCEASVSFHT